MNGIKVDIINRKIIINKTFANKMSNTSSPEYNEYERLVTINQGFTVEIKVQKTYDHNKYKGLNYKFIEAYIYCHEIDDNSRRTVFAEYIEERWKALAHTCGFQEVRAWFIQKYPEFDNLYFKSHAEPHRSQIEKLMAYSACIENGKLIFSEEQKLLTA